MKKKLSINPICYKCEHLRAYYDGEVGCARDCDCIGYRQSCDRFSESTILPFADTAYCVICGKAKPLSEFYLLRGKPDSYCKDCRKKDTARRAKTFKETCTDKERDRVIKYRRNYYDSHKEYWAEWGRKRRAKAKNT